jgi:hypothetical protein
LRHLVVVENVCKTRIDDGVMREIGCDRQQVVAGYHRAMLSPA